jgi:hypothetical protein
VHPRTVRKVRQALAAEADEADERCLITEREFEDAACRELAKLNISYRRQVRCSVGIADIVDKHFVYELKVRPDRSAIFSAVGQACLYAQALGRKPAVVFNTWPDDEFEDAIEKAGVRLVVLEP